MIARLTVNSTPLGAMPLKNFTRDDMSTWREALPARTRTQNGKAYGLLVSVFGDAVREGNIAASPAMLRGAGTPTRAREPHTMTATEINAYLDAADPKWRVALLLSGDMRPVHRGNPGTPRTGPRLQEGAAARTPNRGRGGRRHRTPTQRPVGPQDAQLATHCPSAAPHTRRAPRLARQARPLVSELASDACCLRPNPGFRGRERRPPADRATECNRLNQYLTPMEHALTFESRVVRLRGIGQRRSNLTKTHRNVCL